MDKSNVNIIVIDDEVDLEEDEFIFELKKIYEKVIVKPTPDEGITYIATHLEDKNIVLLDYRFTDAKNQNGSYVLDAIRKESKNIPVILWTANSDKIKEFAEIINNRVFAIMPKSPYEPVLKIIKDAEIELNTSLEGAIEEWITIQDGEELDTPYLVTANGKQYTLRELLKEIRLQTPFGQQTSKDLLMLTIDLLLRNKEKLNG